MKRFAQSPQPAGLLCLFKTSNPATSLDSVFTNNSHSTEMRIAIPCPEKAKVKRLSQKRTGAFTVEFAFCCSIFFVVMMAGIEFTRFMYARHSVDQAAYESARVGIIPGATPAEVELTARRILNATGIRGATVDVTPSSFNEETETVNVRIKCDYSENSWIGPVFLVGAKIESNLTLDHENKAFLVTERDPDIGDNENEPIDE